MSIPNDNAQTMPTRVPPEGGSTRPTRVSQPVPPSQPPPSSGQPPTAEKPRRRTLKIIFSLFLGFLVVFLITAAGGILGYKSGVDDRIRQQVTQIAFDTNDQYTRAQQDIQAGRFETAKRRLEAVIDMNPNFPGARDAYAQVLLKIAQAKTPTEAPTPTLTPTPDMRPAQQLFDQIVQDMANKDWDHAIETIETLRQTDRKFNAVNVDGFYYISLRFRGVNKILRQGNLEGGMYDLALAERFAPLDRDADSYRNWARYYVSGASFWEVDWEKVIFYFGQVASAFPNMMDGSKLTARERLREAYIGYGDQLFGKADWCKAAENYQAALGMAPDPKVETKFNDATLKCSPPTNTPLPTTPATPTHTITVPVATTPVETTPPAAETPTHTPTETPTETPTP